MGSAANLNLKKVKKILEKVFGSYGSNGLDFKYEMQADRLIAKNDLTLNGCDDEIYASFTFYREGNACLDFYFDYIDINEETLRLVNAFNDNVYYLKACINEKDCLVISHPVEYLTEKAVAECVERTLDDVVRDRTKQYLLPLTELTTGKN